MEGAAGEIHLGDMFRDELRADMLRLGAHLLHQPGPLDHVGKAGIIFHIGGDRELAARLDAFDKQGIQHSTRGIDRRRISGRPGPDDDQFFVARRHAASNSDDDARPQT